MGYLISAYFDEKSNRELSKYIREIADETGNSFMTENQVPPHLTISFFEARSDEDAKQVFEKIEEKLTGGNIVMPSVGAFFPNVIYAETVLNEYLFELSTMVNEELEQGKDIIVNRHYKPLSWLPHVTLGKTLEDDQMRIAFEYLQKHFHMMDVKIERFGLAKTNPHRDMLIWK